MTIEDDDELDVEENFKDDHEGQIGNSQSSQPLLQSSSCSYHLTQSPEKQSDVDFDYKTKAVEFWRSAKTRKKTFKCVKKNFRKLQSQRQLYRWAVVVDKGGTTQERQSQLDGIVMKKFSEAKRKRLIVHDQSLRRFALIASKELF